MAGLVSWVCCRRGSLIVSVGVRLLSNRQVTKEVICLADDAPLPDNELIAVLGLSRNAAASVSRLVERVRADTDFFFWKKDDVTETTK